MQRDRSHIVAIVFALLAALACTGTAVASDVEEAQAPEINESETLADLPTIEPIAHWVVPREFEVHDAASPDGRSVYLFGQRRYLSVTATMAYYWQYLLAAGFALAAIVTGWLLLRTVRRRRRVGEPYCRKCNYQLTGIESAHCPECGRNIEGRNRIIAKPALGRILLLLVLTLATANTAVWLGYFEGREDVNDGGWLYHIEKYDPSIGNVEKSVMYSRLLFRIAHWGDWRILRDLEYRDPTAIAVSDIVVKLDADFRSGRTVLYESFTNVKRNSYYRVQHIGRRIVAGMYGTALVVDPGNDTVRPYHLPSLSDASIAVTGDSRYLFALCSIMDKREIRAVDLAGNTETVFDFELPGVSIALVGDAQRVEAMLGVGEERYLLDPRTGDVKREADGDNMWSDLVLMDDNDLSIDEVVDGHFTIRNPKGENPVARGRVGGNPSLILFQCKHGGMVVLEAHDDDRRSIMLYDVSDLTAPDR